jgi:hypothetical protein
VLGKATLGDSQGATSARCRLRENAAISRDLTEDDSWPAGCSYEATFCSLVLHRRVQIVAGARGFPRFAWRARWNDFVSREFTRICDGDVLLRGRTERAKLAEMRENARETARIAKRFATFCSSSAAVLLAGSRIHHGVHRGHGVETTRFIRKCPAPRREGARGADESGESLTARCLGLSRFQRAEAYTVHMYTQGGRICQGEIGPAGDAGEPMSLAEEQTLL